MGEPSKIAQKIDPHLRDLAIVDAVLAAAPRSEMYRKIFPKQFWLLFQGESESDILKFKIGRNHSQRFSQRRRAHEAIGNVRIRHMTAGRYPKQEPAAKGNENATDPIIASPAVTEDAIASHPVPVKRAEKYWIALPIRVDLENPG
jgi:hypothetical protein